MKIFTFFFISFILSPSIIATEVRVLNFQFIIEESKPFQYLLKNIEDDQIVHKKKFVDQEKELEKELKKIEKSKLILDESEIEISINKYNENLNILSQNISKYNQHYEKQIKNTKDLIISKLLEILKKYSSENQIDLILDANNYILSSNSINITDIILNELNLIKIEYSFEKYK